MTGRPSFSVPLIHPLLLKRNALSKSFPGEHEHLYPYATSNLLVNEECGWSMFESEEVASFLLTLLDSEMQKPD